MRGRKLEDGKRKIIRETAQKSPKMAEIRAEVAKFSFRQLPSASADTQHMRGRKLEDGKTELLEKRPKNSPQMAEVRAVLAKFSFCQLPPISVSLPAAHGQGAVIEH